MKVAIDARLRDPRSSGGVSQFVISLATALSGLTDNRPGEEFIFITLESAGNWLDPYIGGSSRLHKVAMDRRTRIARTPLGPLARLAMRAVRRMKPPAPVGITNSDGIVEALNANLVHFPTQLGYLTTLPSIYQPHDLQHIHLPHFFQADEIAWRAITYPAYCHAASYILVESSWTKRDVAAQFGIDPSRIIVCPFPPATIAYREPAAETVAQIKRELRPQDFIFYPAQTWPHKNHLKLLEAIAVLKDRGLCVPLVCTGRMMDNFPEIQATIERLGILDRVQFLGYRSEEEIKLLYRLCTAIVVPTKFESVSFPIWEAFDAAKPVACSSATSLPEQVGHAGLVFDPDEPREMADAIQKLWESPALRDELGRAGNARLHQFSLEETAQRIRALYRRITNTNDTTDDAILDAAPLI